MFLGRGRVVGSCVVLSKVNPPWNRWVVCRLIKGQPPIESLGRVSSCQRSNPPSEPCPGPAEEPCPRTTRNAPGPPEMPQDHQNSPRTRTTPRISTVNTQYHCWNNSTTPQTNLPNHTDTTTYRLSRAPSGCRRDLLVLGGFGLLPVGAALA